MQNRFTKDMSCQINLVFFFNSCFLDKGNAADLIYLDSSEAFGVMLCEEL